MSRFFNPAIVVLTKSQQHLTHLHPHRHECHYSHSSISLVWRSTALPVCQHSSSRSGDRNNENNVLGYVSSSRSGERNNENNVLGYVQWNVSPILYIIRGAIIRIKHEKNLHRSSEQQKRCEISCHLNTPGGTSSLTTGHTYSTMHYMFNQNIY